MTAATDSFRRRHQRKRKAVKSIDRAGRLRIGSAGTGLALAVVRRNPTSGRNAIVLGAAEQAGGRSRQLSVFVWGAPLGNLHLVRARDRRLGLTAIMRLQEDGIVFHVAGRKFCRQDLPVVV